MMEQSDESSNSAEMSESSSSSDGSYAPKSSSSGDDSEDAFTDHTEDFDYDEETKTYSVQDWPDEVWQQHYCRFPQTSARNSGYDGVLDVYENNGFGLNGA